MIFSAAILNGIERRFSPLVGETWKKKRKNKEIPLIFVAHFVRWDHQRPTGKGYWKRYVPSFSHDFEMQIFTGKGILSSWECRNPIIVSTFFSGLVELIEKTGRGKGGGGGRGGRTREMRRWIRYLCSWVSVINVGRILNFSLFLEYFLLLEIGVTHGINLEKSMEQVFLQTDRIKRSLQRSTWLIERAVRFSLFSNNFFFSFKKIEFNNLI